MRDPETARVFVGFKVGGIVRDRVADLYESVRLATTGYRWAKPDQLHLTLAFLGDVSPARVADVVRVTETVARGHAAFDVEWRGLGCFPKAERANILWMGVGQGAAETTALQKRLAHAYSSIGIPPDQRFTPHVTLARARASRSKADDLRGLLRDHGEEDFGVERVSEITVFRSEFAKGGSVYSALAVAPLAGG